MGSVGDPGVSDWPWSGPFEVCRLHEQKKPGVYPILVFTVFCVFLGCLRIHQVGVFPTDPGVY